MKNLASPTVFVRFTNDLLMILDSGLLCKAMHPV